jgi:polysaccharide pyruvyl transferase WcaK-like protein
MGYFARGNLGDDAMYDALVSFMITGSTRFTARSRSLPSLHARRVLPAIGLLRDLRWADVVVLVGGTHFHDDHGARSYRVLSVHWLLFRVARGLGASIVYAGIGIGPLSTRTGRWLTRQILRQAEAIYTRDRPSRREVDRLGIAARSVEGADLAFLLPPPHVDKPDACDAVRIAVSIIPYFHVFESRSGDEAAVSSIVQAISAITRHTTVTVDVLALNTAGFISDIPLANDLFAELAAVTDVERFDHLAAQSTFDRLAMATRLLSTRYHSALLGYLLELPMVLVAYQSKCRFLATQIGLPDHAVLEPADLVDADRMVEILTRLVSHPDEFRCTVPRQHLEQATRAALDTIRGDLMGA